MKIESCPMKTKKSDPIGRWYWPICLSQKDNIVLDDVGKFNLSIPKKFQSDTRPSRHPSWYGSFVLVKLHSYHCNEQNLMVGEIDLDHNQPPEWMSWHDSSSCIMQVLRSLRPNEAHGWNHLTVQFMLRPKSTPFLKTWALHQRSIVQLIGWRGHLQDIAGCYII